MSLVNTETAALAERIDADEARVLTERIKNAAEEVWNLLVEAHDRKAWAALGYDTFADYVGAEFDMSRRHAYRLLDQAEVIRELEAVVVDVTHGSHAPVAITERQARDIKPRLKDVSRDIKREVESAATVDPDKVKAIVSEVVEEHREQARQEAEDRAALADLNAKAKAAGMDTNPDSLAEKGALVRLCGDIAKQRTPSEFVALYRKHLTPRIVTAAEQAYAWLDEFLLEIKEGE